MKRIFTAAAIVTVLLFSGCYYDNIQELYPVPIAGCDSSGTVTYNNRVKDIITTYCSVGSSSCHNNNSTSGIPLDSYQAVVDAASGSLMDAIKQQNGVSPMPKDGGKLDATCIAVIEKWINNGTPEN